MIGRHPGCSQTSDDLAVRRDVGLDGADVLRLLSDAGCLAALPTTEYGAHRGTRGNQGKNAGVRVM